MTVNELDRSDAAARAWARTGSRYCRYRRFPTKLCVVDPEGSAFWQAYLAALSANPSR